MEKLLAELNITKEEVIVILSEELDIVVSDETNLDLLDDEVINELYTTVYTSQVSWSELANYNN